MDYDEARAAFFAPREGEARPLGWESPARRVRDAVEPLATVCYWSEPSYQAYADRGLDFLLGYVWSRASSLGEPEPTVVSAAFGVFEPGLVEGVYEQARASCSLADVRAARVDGAVATLAAVLGEAPEGLEAAVDALERACDAAPVLGRPFFAGLRGHDRPDHVLGRLWHACNQLREHRGDSHLQALAGAQLDGLEANLLTELWVGWEPTAYAGSRGWAPEAMAAATDSLQVRGLVSGGELTSEGRDLRERVEQQTDDLQTQVVDALGADLEPVVARLAGWSEQVVASGWFPPDPYKRAAG